MREGGRSFEVCTRCVMDTTDPDIRFDEHGVCNHCHDFDNLQKPRILEGEAGQKALEASIARIKKRGEGRDYDCIIGLSGGVDSTYVAYKVKELGLRPLAIHVDTGWNSELAVNNIENVVKKLNLDLRTFVIDWEEMRDLQLSFFKAGLANCDIPQDHAFVAVLYKTAVKHGIRSIISGHNLATESILPEAWGYTSIDLRHIASVQKRFGTVKLRNYPRYNLFQYAFQWPYLKGLKIFPILNYMPYVKEDAKKFVQEHLDWRDYGGKHYESQFTKFFQAYYLPHKFGFDKRKAHLSSLIVSGQMSREEALQELNKPLYDARELAEHKAFIAKKLGIDEKEFDAIIEGPAHTYRDYPSNAAVINAMLNFKTAVRKWLSQ